MRSPGKRREAVGRVRECERCKGNSGVWAAPTSKNHVTSPTSPNTPAVLGRMYGHSHMGSLQITISASSRPLASLGNHTSALGVMPVPT